MTRPARVPFAFTRRFIHNLILPPSWAIILEHSLPTVSAERLFVENLRLIDDTIRLVCRRLHCSPEEREDFSSQSRLKLIEDDYAVLRKYGGRCSLRTFLVTVIRHQLYDYRRQRWGTWRPSAEARRLGPAAVELDTLLHRDRVAREEAVERLHGSARFAETRDELRRLADLLPPHYPRIVEGESALEDLAEPRAGADRDLLAEERVATVRAARAALAASLAELGDEDRVVLRLRFQDGLKVPRIAQILGTDAKALYRRCDRLLEQLRGILERRGVAGSAVLECLGEDSWADEDGPEGSH
jgi:RNA polymerase sigma factor (sigma-70 family)